VETPYNIPVACLLLRIIDIFACKVFLFTILVGSSSAVSTQILVLCVL